MTFSPLIIDAGQQRQLPSNGLLQTNEPAVRASRSTDQSVNGSNAINLVQFDATAFSFGGSWWSSGNPTRLTVPTNAGGIYLIGGTIRMLITNTGNVQQLGLRLNGTTTIQTQGYPYPINTQTYEYSIQTVYSLSAGDYVELVVQFSLASTRTIISSGIQTPALWAARLR